MACLFTDAVGIAERGDRVAATHRLLDKFFAYSHEIGSPPRHSSLQGCVPTKVSRNNASTYLCSRSRTYPSSRSVPAARDHPPRARQDNEIARSRPQSSISLVRN